jgi:protein arginine kinase
MHIMKLDTLAQSIGEWLRGTGPESDIVMSSRVRLARNLPQYPFVSRASEQDRADIERFLRERIAMSSAGPGLESIDVGGLEEIMRLASRPIRWPSAAGSPRSCRRAILTCR